MTNTHTNTPLEEIVSSTTDSDENTELKGSENKDSFFKRLFSFYSKDHLYFKPRKIERWKDGLIYKLLGVHFFKKIVPTCGEYVNKLIDYHPIKDAESKEEGLKKWEPFTRITETIHAPIFTLMTAGIVGDYLNGGYGKAITWGLINLVINGYPAMLQRYNRARIYNALDEIESNKDLK